MEEENKNEVVVDSSVMQINASQQEVTREMKPQPVDRFDFLGDAEVVYREEEDGEEKRALVSDLFKAQKESGKPVWLKLCAHDKYGYKVHAWRPCRFGLFGYVDVPVNL